MARILVVDDEEDLRAFCEAALAGAGHDVATAADGVEALDALARRRFDLVLTDLRMPRLDGEALLRQVRAAWPDVAVIVLTAHGSVAKAVEAMRLGVSDFLEKPVESPGALRAAVTRALGRDPMADVEGVATETRLSWGAAAMVAVESALRRVAPTDATVLLEGESGVGKEVAARAIHRWSRRAAGPFAAINCASLSETLLESELFGHERGAFTGAVTQRAGHIEAAAGGTFFLDEVGELAPSLQAKLLRVLQENEYTRVGGTRTLVANVRWVAATNRELLAAVGAGRFRADLYHRLSVFPVKIPALRERREDIAPLAQAIVARLRVRLGRPGLRLSAQGLAALTAMPFPGNVRDLSNTLERAAILSDGDELQLDAPLPGVPATTAAPASTDAPTLEEAELTAIRQALQRHDGNRKRAAEHLGMGLRTLYEKLKRYRLT
ncbi:MAG: sigma-54 dependent transcriptional regulator [Deltaproteobacteria bacterium]|nr:sigma-54 dependent transcriptional regulator [Myxococcales bacterium]MDP3216568.1 sigma-54 dependent transcriptional regulator [Deltaproteobacteria bacterium]